MLVKNALVTLLGVAMAVEAASVAPVRAPGGLVRRQNRFGGKNNGQNNNQNNQNNNQNGQNNNQQQNGNQNNNNNNNNNNQNGDASVTCLAANAVQTGSQSTGQNGAAADGQVESEVDFGNFINICSGKTLTNGLQNRDGSCNGIPMGEIPSVEQMVSTVILNPKGRQILPPFQTFTIQLNVANINLGSFTNATSTYYTAPQRIGNGGRIIGHTHVTVQDAGNTLDPTTPLDPKQFVFFKGINDAGNGQGLLQTDVTDGLPVGIYRLCTMSSASNHQPVLMPVAQRGSQEDCKYFCVDEDEANSPCNAGANGQAGAGAGAGAGNNNNNGQDGQNNNQDGQNNGQDGQNNNQDGQNNNNGQDGQNNNGQDGQNNNQGNQNGQQNNQQGNQNGQQNNQQGKQNGQQNNQQGKQNGGKQNGQQNAQNNNQQGNQNGQQGNQQGKQNGQQNAQNNNQGAQNNNQGAQNNNQGAQNNGGGAGGVLGGIAAPAIEDSGDQARPFSVNGNTFVNREAAAQRACAIQNNACANAANSGAEFSTADCNAQEQACRAAA